MSEAEEKDVQAFTELQNRVLENSEKQKYVQQQQQANQQQLRRAVLTAAELEKLPEDTPCYDAVGKAYLLTPRNEIFSALQTQASESSAEVKRAEEAEEGIKRSMEAIEREVRELLQNSPALARAFAAAGR